MGDSGRTGHTLEDGPHASHGYLWCAESSTAPKVALLVAHEVLEEQMAEPHGSL